MKPRTSPWLAALLLAAASATVGTAQATNVLYEQAPLQTANALANGSDGQAPLLAETFTFSGVASSLSWWGTPGEGFDVSLTSGSGTGPVFTQPSVTATAAGFTVSVDIDGDLQDDTVDVYRYSIDLGALSAGTYTLALREITTDALGRSWFWLHGQAGDGGSISGLGERDQQPNLFDLSLRVDGERGGTVPEPATALMVAAALGLLGARSTRRRGPAV
jgi:PEP-CTERM motif